MSEQLLEKLREYIDKRIEQAAAEHNEAHDPEFGSSRRERITAEEAWAAVLSAATQA